MAFFRRSPEKQAEKSRRRAEKDARAHEKKEVAEANARLRVEKAEARLANDRARAALRLQRLQAKLSTTSAREELREKRDVRVLGARKQKLARTSRGAGIFFGGSARPIGSGSVVPLREHAESHSSPSHHVGPCDGACRAGRRSHTHRARA